MNRRARDLPFTVVTFLGSVGVLALLLDGALTYRTIESYSPEHGLDPAIVGLIGGITSIATGALSALGAILATTGRSSQPTPVVVTNEPADPVPVDAGLVDTTFLIGLILGAVLTLLILALQGQINL